MNPLKRKYIVDKTANELSLPTDVVDEVISFFYAHVQKKLTKPEFHSVNVPNLGTFVVKRKNVLAKIEKNNNIINKLQNSEHITVSMYETIVTRQKDNEILKSLLASLDEENERKEQVKQKRKIYENGKSNKNLEE